MTRVSISVGEQHFTLEPSKTMDGTVEDYRSVLRRDARGGFVLVEIVPVHNYGCPATRMGLKHGPCKCGAEDVFDGLIGLVQQRTVRAPWRTPRS